MNWKTDKAILAQLERFSIVTDRFMPVSDREHATLSIQRLIRERKISEWQHRSGLRYWTRRSSGPMSDASLAKCFATVAFITGSPSKAAITTSQLLKYFPSLHRHGLPRGHYVDREDDCPKLGIVRVDTGQAKISRLVQRTQRMTLGYRRQLAFRQLIDARRFEITWVLPTRRKRQRLDTALLPLQNSGVQLHTNQNETVLNIVAPLTCDRQTI